jgi:hypothetical protein
VEAPSCPNEAEEKDLLESNRLTVVANLKMYQDEMRSGLDPKVKIREFNVGDLILLPFTEPSHGEL